MSLEANQRKGYQVLTDLSLRDGLTIMGANWLAKILDPYHDSTLLQTGIPDTFDAKSVTREYRQTIDVSKSSLGLTGTGQWEVQFNFFPFFCNTRANLVKSNRSRAAIGNGVANNLPVNDNRVQLYPFHISAKNSIAPLPLWPIGLVGDGDSAWKGATDLPNGYYHGGMDIPFHAYNAQRCRIVAAGFEVVNTTALQYMNGTCTVYRPRAELDVAHQQVNANHTYFGPWAPLAEEKISQRLVVNTVQLPFATPAQAMRCDNVRQWSATEGAYCTGVLDINEMCEFTTPMDMTPVMALCRFDAGTDQPVVFSDTGRCVSFPGNGLIYTEPLYVNALETSCALFTGLDPNTSFTVNVKWTVETVPDQWRDDNWLATTPTSFDPVALEYYRRVVRDIPAGVMVKDNPLGEWFVQIMNILADHAVGVGTGIGTIFGAPGVGAAIGGGVGAAARALGRYNQNLLNQSSRAKIITK